MAFIGGRAESEIWVMASDGESPRKLLQGLPRDRFLQLQWSPRGDRIAALKSHSEGDVSETVVETMPLSGGKNATILSAPGLNGFCWSSDGHIIYSMNEKSPNDRDANLWELPVDSSGATVSGSPRRITNWAGLSLTDLSVSTDGKRLAFVNAGYRSDLYVAPIEAQGSLGQPRRLTLEGNNSFPSAWMPDGQSLLFYSDRNGRWNIFREGLQEQKAEDFIVGSGKQTEARLSPDGSWVLYWDYAESQSPKLASMSLKRVPVSGGAPQLVLEASRGASVRCVTRRSTCILSERDSASGKLVFSAVDPLGGRKGELVRVAADPARSPAWDLSGDGSAVAIVNLDENQGSVRVIKLATGASRLIAVKPSERLSGVTWSADGNGWFVTSSSIRGATIFHVSAGGGVTQSWTNTSNLGTPLTSPDGRNLAFTISTFNSNAWMIENF
ncbi:MAG TPA: hypothetical protein VGU63_06635 [Candidatus Acidoferrales bacterium]|nr:hypothetical protein [Candidatus Acidoferrales bacterium]